MTIKTVDLRWIFRTFLIMLPRLLVAVISIFWVYHSADYFIKFGHRILAGVKFFNQIPVGGDFCHYWAAGRLALSGNPASAYDPVCLRQSMETFFGPLTFKIPYLYPPTFLLGLLPLALLPYHVSLATWLLTTFAGYLLVLRRIAPHFLAVLLGMMFGATFENFGYGQNGFLSTALLGGGLLLLDGTPLAGGALLGLLTYKPHLAVLAVVALVAGRRWKALAAMAAAASALILASGLILGYGVWEVFLSKNIPLLLKSVDSGNAGTINRLPWATMQTLFSAIYSSRLGLGPAIMSQGLMALAVTLLVWRVWRQAGSLALRGSILVLGTLLFTPYLFVYDLCLLALPLAWIAWDGYKNVYFPGERYLLFFGWVFPLFSEDITKASSLPIAPLILLMFIFLTLWHFSQQRLPTGQEDGTPAAAGLLPG